MGKPVVEIELLLSAHHHPIFIAVMHTQERESPTRQILLPWPVRCALLALSPNIAASHRKSHHASPANSQRPLYETPSCPVMRCCRCRRQLGWAMPLRPCHPWRGKQPAAALEAPPAPGREGEERILRCPPPPSVACRFLFCSGPFIPTPLLRLGAAPCCPSRGKSAMNG